MNFRDHSNLSGRHAFLSASSYHWLNYDSEKLATVYFNAKAKERGTMMHDFAAQCIRLGEKLADSKKTLNLYVNDAIRYNMIPEQVLYYSDRCFGTADTICFRRNILRIHDYKSGEQPAHMEQLKIYAALFCLEYGKKPKDITTELRIYQFCDKTVERPEPEEIEAIMKKIIDFDKQLIQLELGGIVNE